MITLANVEHLERFAKHFLRKCTFAKSALQHLETIKKLSDVTGYNRDLGQKDAERQERILLEVATELHEELGKVLDQAKAQPTGDSR